MSAYRIDGLPGNAVVSSLVTLAIGVWFLVVAGAMLADTRPVAPARARTMSACAASSAPDLSAR